MSRDYKNRVASRNKKPQQQNTVAWWKWLLIFLLLALFVIFLVFLKGSSPKPKLQTEHKTATTAVQAKKKPKHQNKQRVEPRYDFYTILPETEIVVPDNEINTRRREEFLGKRKAGHYNVQAGSFRNFAEADKLKAKLALMGIESRVEKATVGGATWNRIKMGPFSSSSQVSILKKRLKKNGVDIIVTEIKQ